MSTIQEVVPMRGSEQGIALLIDSWRNQIKYDQQYREFQQNAIEAIQRVQKKNPDYRGVIKWKVDETHLKRFGMKKLCIIDNGEGMTAEEMHRNINNLGGSSRNNQNSNFGCGAKIAGLSYNRAGLIYKSWKDGKGFAIKFLRNGRGEYGMAKINGRSSFPLSKEDKPEEIGEHGCMVTLLGDTDKQNTILPPTDTLGLLKGSKLSQADWLTAYLNTKFYILPNNISTSVERFGVPNSGGGKLFNYIKGHEYGLVNNFDKVEEIQLTQTRVKIFFRTKETYLVESGRTDFLAIGQLGIRNNDEIIKLSFNGKHGANPLPAWGLQCIRKNVALILIPDGEFVQNIERTDLNYNGRPIEEQMTLWKSEFKEKMPDWLKDIEAKKQQEQLDKDNDMEERLKKLSPLFKKEGRYFNSNKGDTDIEESDKRKASSKMHGEGNDIDNESKPNPFDNPEDEFGKIEALFGIKVDKSKYKGKKANTTNEYPDVLRKDDGPSYTIGTFFPESYSIEINVESNLVVEMVEYLKKKFPKIAKKNVTSEVFNLIGFSLRQQVAHVYNRTDSTLDEKYNILSDLGLTAMAANKDYIIDRLSIKFKNNNNWKGVKEIKAALKTKKHSYNRASVN